MKIFLPILLLYLLFKFIQARNHYSKIKEKISYNLLQIEQMIMENPKNPILYCKRGTLYMKIQDLVKARNDFKRALFLIEEGIPVLNKENMTRNIMLNISYTEKPLPWSKNCPKNFTGSILFYFLVDRFGALRYYF